MILLKDERELNDQTLMRWDDALRTIAERAWGTHRERGLKLDLTPIHHRIAPGGMLHEIKKRGLRIQSFMDNPRWHSDPHLLDKLIDECVDIANFATFLGAFATLLKGETIAGAAPSTPQREGGNQ